MIPLVFLFALPHRGGVTALTAGRQREISFDLLFKKPWRLTSTVEFMPAWGLNWRAHTAGTRARVRGQGSPVAYRPRVASRSTSPPLG